MNLVDCYTAMQGDYADVMNRLPKEAMVIKFLRKFVDNDDFANMLVAVEAKDYGTVFTTSHNLKGMCANLSMTALMKSSSDVCEAVRGGEPTIDILPLVEKAKEDYERTIAAIKELED